MEEQRKTIGMMTRRRAELNLNRNPREHHQYHRELHLYAKPAEGRKRKASPPSPPSSPSPSPPPPPPPPKLAAAKRVGIGRGAQFGRASETEILAKRGYLLSEGKLGEGRYAKVFRARCLDSEAAVAIKVVELRNLRPSYFQRFLSRELAILQRLDHPNILRLHEHFREGTRWYLVTDVMEGGDLLSFVQSHGPLSPSLSRPWLRQLLQALAYLHSKRIAHRDLKLENLLIGGRKEVVVADFGFSKEVKGGVARLSETFCGSKAYSCHEILQGIPYCPFKADIFAVGVIALILFTSKMPFNDAMAVTDIVAMQEEHRYVFPERLGIPNLAKDLALQALNFHPNHRPHAKKLLSHKWLAFS